MDLGVYVAASESESSHRSGEIDLLELVRAIANTWRPWLAALLIVSVFFTAYHAISLLLYRPVMFEKSVRLSPMVSSSEDFEVDQILAPSVLQAVHTQLQLSNELQLSLPEFLNRLKIDRYTPFYDEYMKRYDILLSDDNIRTHEDALPIMVERSAAIEEALEYGARIQFDARNLNLSPTQATAILSAILSEWSDQKTTDMVRGVQVRLVSANSLDDALFEQVDFIVLDDLFREKVAALSDNIRWVEKLPGSMTVVDPQTGWNLSDLQANLNDLSLYLIDDVMAPIRALGLSRSPKLASFYYQQRQQRLLDQQALLLEKSQEYRSAYEAFLLVSKNGNAARNSRSGQQLTGVFIEKAFAAIGNGTAEKYLQELNEGWLESKLKIAQLESEMNVIERTLKVLGGIEAATADFEGGYVGKVNAKVPELLGQLRDYYQVNQRIYQQISHNVQGMHGSMYEDLHQGVVAEGNRLNVKRLLLLFLATLFFTTFVVVPVVLLRNALAKPKEVVA